MLVDSHLDYMVGIQDSMKNSQQLVDSPDNYSVDMVENLIQQLDTEDMNYPRLRQVEA